MTRNQLEWLALQETKRSNVAREKETERSNRAQEGLTASRDQRSYETKLIELDEVGRHNLATESEAFRSNVAKETENTRSNVAKEQETHRHNVVYEELQRTAQKETQRHNVATESLSSQQIGLGYSQLAESQRHNQRTEVLTANQNAIAANRAYYEALEAESRNAQRAASVLQGYKSIEISQQQADTASYNAMTNRLNQRASEKKIDSDVKRNEVLNRRDTVGTIVDVADTASQIKRRSVQNWTDRSNAMTNGLNAVVNGLSKIIELK